MKRIRKMIGLWMTVLLFTGSFCIVMPEESVYAYEVKEGTVTGDSVNVRKGAGTDSDTVTSLSRGHAVQVKGETNAANGAVWYQISFTKDSKAMEGYMRADYVRITYSEERDGYVTADGVRVRDSAGTGTNNKIITQLNTGHELKIKGEARDASTWKIWYWISFTEDGEYKEGYMHSSYVRAAEKPSKPSEGAEDTEYEAYLEAQGFPESYRRYLRSLHQINPLWIFVAQPTGIEWETAVAEESKLGKNLVPAGSITSFKSLKEGAVDWASGSWIGFDGASWVPASENVIRYYMDPRNFLQGENTMLQFQLLEYKEGEQTKEGINNLLQGTHMEYGKTVIDGQTIDFAQIFLDAGRENNINPYHLAARAKQETGINGSNSTRQFKDAEYAEFNGYYNFFNIGASPSKEYDSMYNGLQRAKDEGWDSPEKSITGGAKFVAERYVTRGQNTLYLQKFDMVDGGDGYYAHQYMTNLQAAASEARLMEQAYGDFRGAAVTYSVPVFKNMPDVPKARPTDNGSPYSVLSDLSVSDLQLDKPFEEYTFEYTVIGEVQAQSVNINAAAYAPGAVVAGTGSVELRDGENRLEVQCTGTDGSVRTYTIVVNCQNGYVPPVRPAGDVNGDYAINAIDALLVLRVSVGLETISEESMAYADVNHNGQPDAGDALLILQYITGEVAEL